MISCLWLVISRLDLLSKKLVWQRLVTGSLSNGTVETNVATAVVQGVPLNGPLARRNQERIFYNTSTKNVLIHKDLISNIL
jgi:hypothetical protein